MRKYAAQLGITSVKVWACSYQCYDSSFPSRVTEGSYVWLPFLPVTETKYNRALAYIAKAYKKKQESEIAQAIANRSRRLRRLKIS